MQVVPGRGDGDGQVEGQAPEAVWEVLRADFHKVPPWNRRMRRKVEAAKKVLHLFSGKDQSFWQDSAEVVLCLDLQRGQCSRGKISGIVGGPPCRTVSAKAWARATLEQGRPEKVRT